MESAPPPFNDSFICRFILSWKSPDHQFVTRLTTYYIEILISYSLVMIKLLNQKTNTT